MQSGLKTTLPQQQGQVMPTGSNNSDIRFQTFDFLNKPSLQSRVETIDLIHKQSAALGLRKPSRFTPPEQGFFP
ncbi:hypothetical protein AA3271_0841 [Gluconobacter japonicus NBRC 3271]|nr:hypothetical protein AA3271_0841 [Gluconobacter japonicus NBRC 3271]